MTTCLTWCLAVSALATEGMAEEANGTRGNLIAVSILGSLLAGVLIVSLIRYFVHRAHRDHDPRPRYDRPVPSGPHRSH